ncbi:MAG: hypothetical protein L0H63_03425 [Nitrococcus sp.]|nr:hypothetical protein [Nitrococcus sp.]
MIAELKKIWAICTPAERRKSIGMLVLVILMAMAETLGVLSIMPFLSVLSRPEVIQETAFLKTVYDHLGFNDARSFIFALGIGSIILVVCSSSFKTVTLHVLNRFVHFLRHCISARVLSRYLHQPYEFFLSRNPSILARNVLSEIDQLLAGLIQPLSQLLAQGTVVLAMALLVPLVRSTDRCRHCRRTRWNDRGELRVMKGTAHRTLQRAKRPGNSTPETVQGRLVRGVPTARGLRFKMELNYLYEQPRTTKSGSAGPAP